jgi:hypothetical protein
MLEEISMRTQKEKKRAGKKAYILQNGNHE